MKKSVVGLLAHVDAGKTTLAESMLYLSGTIRKQGRVDHGDSFLDFDRQEQKRGITIFSSQARLNWKNTALTLIDTPGHLDFSNEMERSLSVLDYAIVVLNGKEGIQSHSETIWHLLDYYQIPAFIFVNKMDIAQNRVSELMNMLEQHLSECCINFTSKDQDFYESVSLTSEALLDDYLDKGTITDIQISDEIEKRNIFPCFFGSALKNQGVREFLDLLDTYIKPKSYGDDFKARVFKVNHDKNEQLTHIKITGGQIKVKDTLENGEKIDGIRLYSGLKYQSVQKAKAGDVCTLLGIHKLKAGDVLGQEQSLTTQLSPYMNYRVVLSNECDQNKMLDNLKQLALEDPSLHLTYRHGDIYLSIMGKVQLEILRNMIKERFGEDVTFDQGEVQYKETILEPVEGVGHYEPLRHYSEVHILLEPLKLGSGLQFDVKGDIPMPLQRLILSHMQEKEQLGVLIGAPVTDMKMTLVGAKDHVKHTVGGDFRQATYRAIRQGLKMTKCALLEPYYDFRLEVPESCLSRALYQLDDMSASFSIESQSDTCVITGSGPIAAMKDYQQTVISYTKGRGRLYLQFGGYQKCHNSQEVIDKYNYDSEKDLDNPTGSIFCSHGSGFYVPYNKVYDYMHLPLVYIRKKNTSTMNSYKASVEELDDIFVRTYGPIKQRTFDISLDKKEIKASKEIPNQKPQCLIVDGYNVIFTNDELSKIADDNLDLARTRLIDMLSNYQGYKQCILILVFDAYKIKGNPGSIEKHHNIYIVYTKEAQLADNYIERTTHQMAKDFDITVATSDNVEQVVIMGRGAHRISSRQLLLEVESVNRGEYEQYRESQEVNKNYLLEDIAKLNHH